MTKYKGNLELNWINKDQSLYYEYDNDGNPSEPQWIERDNIKVSEPRILKLVREYGDVSGLTDPLDNALIQGDNLLALRTLVEMFKEREEKDKVKCVYLDPPYNTGTAFEKYADNLEHSQWLTMMRDRLILIRKIMRKDGILFVQLDDREMHYAKVLLDEIFDRNNFVATIALSTSTASGVKTSHKERTILKEKEYILVYKYSENSTFNPQFKLRKKWDTHYNLYFDRINMKLIPLKDVLIKNKIMVEGSTLGDLDIDSKVFQDFYLKNKENICQTSSFKNTEIKKKSLENKDNIIAHKNSKGNISYYLNGRELVSLVSSLNPVLSYKNRAWEYKLSLSKLLCDFWDDIDFNNTQSEGTVSFPKSKKPEFLIRRIIELSTKEGDLVLDSFLGSGTTASVAHKAKRRWIGIEIGQHAETHCIVRLNALINGKDQDQKIYHGGFRYYKLGESLLSNYKMNWNLTYEELAQALFMNFDYLFKEKINDNTFFGKSGKNIAICIVAKEMKILKKEEIQKILDKIKNNKTTKITIFTNHGVAIKNEDLPDNITIKKIPESILRKYKL